MIPLPSAALRELDGIKSNLDSTMSSYAQILMGLENQRLLSFFKELARPSLSHDPNVAAAQANWSSGFFDCLQCILNFRELFLEDVGKKESLTPDYGALGILTDKKDLMQGEEDAIRSGKPFDYQGASDTAKRDFAKKFER